MRTFRYSFGFFWIALILGLGFVNSSFSQTDSEKEHWLSYFNDSYGECRTDFRIRADGLKNQFEGVQIVSMQVTSKVDNKLFVDACYVPARNAKKKLLILSCGIHGIEGYVGNAVMDLFMEKFITDDLLDDTGVLLLHAMNPYGFKYMRRVTENNVDLNRNSDILPELYETVNAGYGDLIEFLNPPGQVKAGSMKNRFFFVTAIRKIMQASLPVLRQAVLQGQYQYPDGLYFGGKKQEPQIESVGKLIKGIGKDYSTIFNIDLHTGYGERGKLHFFPNPVDDPVLKKQTEDLFAGYQIDWGDSDDFYTITGDFSGFIGKLLPGKTHIEMTFEYGTMDSQKTMGSIRSIHNMILENQGFHHGYKGDKDKQKVEKRFLEMYYPSDPAWRIKIMEQSNEVLQAVIDRF